MRHALAMFGFCLLLPQAAYACMPMEGASGAEGLVVVMSFFLAMIMFFVSALQWFKMARLPKGSELYPVVRRSRRMAFQLGLGCFALCVTTVFVDTAAVVAGALFSVFLYKIVLPVPVRLVMWAYNALHSIKIAGEKTTSTRRLAAAGDVL